MGRFLFLFLFLLCFSVHCLGNTYVGRALGKVPMFPAEPNLLSPTVQSHCCDVTGYQIEVSKVFSKRRLQLGIGVDRDNRKYHLPESEDLREFESNYTSYFLRLSRYKKLRKKVYGEYGVRLGHGDFTLFEKTGGEVSKKGVNSVAIDGKIFKVFVYRKKIIELLFGIGIQKNFVPSLEINGVTFASSNFGVGANFFLGLAYRH